MTQDNPEEIPEPPERANNIFTQEHLCSFFSGREINGKPSTRVFSRTLDYDGTYISRLGNSKSTVEPIYAHKSSEEIIGYYIPRWELSIPRQDLEMLTHLHHQKELIE